MSGQEWVPEPADLRGDDRPLSPAVGPEPGAAPPPPFSPPAGPAYPPPHVVISPRPPAGDADDEAGYDDDPDADAEADPADGDWPAAPRRRFGFGFRLPRFRARRDNGTETEEGEVEVIAGPDGEPLPPADDDDSAEAIDEPAAPRRRFSFPLRLPRFGRASASGEAEAGPDADGEYDPDDQPAPPDAGAETEGEPAEGVAPSRRTGLLTTLAISREARVGLAAVVSFLVLVALFVNNTGRLVRMTMPNGGENQAAVDPAKPDETGKDARKPDGKDGGKPKPPPAGSELASKASKPGGKPDPTPAKSDDPSTRFETGASGLGANSTHAPGGGVSPLEPGAADPTLPLAAPTATHLEPPPSATATAEVPVAAPTLLANDGAPPLDPPGTTPPANPAAAPAPEVAELPPMSGGTAESTAATPAATAQPMPDPVLPSEPRATEPPSEPRTPETVPDLMTGASPTSATPPTPNPAPTAPPPADPTEPTLPPSGVESAHPADPMPMPPPQPDPAPPPKAEPAAAHPSPIQASPAFEPVPSGPETPAPAAGASPAAPAGPDPEGWTEIPMMGSRRSTIVSTPGGVDVAAGVVAGAAAAASASASEVIPDGPPPREDTAARKQAEIKLHRVAPGENFWTISRRYYGEGRYYKALWAANIKEVPDITVLYVGDVVRIPPPEMLDPARIDPPAATRSGMAADRNLAPDVSRTSNPDDGSDPRSERSVATLPPVRRKPVGDVEPNPNEPPRRPSYIVRANQTLRSIARDTLGDSRRADEILQLNRPQLRDAGDLAPGQRITLPADANVNGRRGR